VHKLILWLLFDYLVVCVQLLGDLLQTIFFYRRLKVLYDDYMYQPMCYFTGRFYDYEPCIAYRTELDMSRSIKLTSRCSLSQVQTYGDVSKIIKIFLDVTNYNK